MACERCPCPTACVGWPTFCAWAAEDPVDPVKIRHIRARGAILGGQSVTGPTLAHDDRRVDVALTLAHLRAMKACPFRSTGPGCGCSGGRCALRRGAVVSHADCFECLGRYSGATEP